MRRLGVAALAVVGLLSFPTSSVDAQPAPTAPSQPGAGQVPDVQPPGAGQQRQPRPPTPGAQPGGPGQPGQPGRRPPARPGQPGGPGQLPPGHPPLPASPPVAPPAPAAHGGHCPGHGPYDPPGHINWYQGVLGVHNEKAQSPRFVDRLLWRYHNPKNECDKKNQEPPVLGSVINFALLLYILVRYGKGPVMDALAKRKKTIMQDVDAATELKVGAEKRLKSYERQMARIEERRKELAEEQRLQWEGEKKRILDEAREKSERLRKDARFRVEQELRQAQADLLAESIEQAVAAAEQLLKSRVGPADQERLADEFLTSVRSALSADVSSRSRA